MVFDDLLTEISSSLLSYFTVKSVCQKCEKLLRNYVDGILASAFLFFKLLQKILTVSKSFDFFGKMLFTYKTVTKNLFGQKLCK